MTAPLDRAPVTDLPANNKGRDRTHWLYLAVIFAVIAGVIVGLTAPSTGKSLTVLGTVFVNLIKMMIAPVIFCTIVLGIGSVRKAAAVGKVGGLALAYFLTMSSVALGIGLIVATYSVRVGICTLGLVRSEAAQHWPARLRSHTESLGSSSRSFRGRSPQPLLKATCYRCYSSRCWSVSRSKAWAPQASPSCVPSRTCKSWCSRCS